MRDKEKIWIRTNMRYDAETGVLERWVTHKGRNALKLPRWKVCPQTPNGRGYAYIEVLGRSIPCQRICWFLACGDITDSLMVDHINGNKLDNRLNNLRLVTRRKNGQNQCSHREGRLVGSYQSTGFRGWRAQIRVSGKVKALGSFATEQEAHEAYVKFCNENNLK
jgi:hypothetical protein